MYYNFRSPRGAKTILAIALSFASAARADAEFVQPQAAFEKAIRNYSTNAYITYVTIVDDNTGEVNTGCMMANSLLSAIHRELDLDYSAAAYERVVRFALTSTSHVFHFSKRAFFKEIREEQSRIREACALVKQGKSVFFTDSGAQLSIDP
jgi:hypothetical protein